MGAEPRRRFLRSIFDRSCGSGSLETRGRRPTPPAFHGAGMGGIIDVGTPSYRCPVRVAGAAPRRSLTARPHAVGVPGIGSGWRQSSPPVSFRCRGSPGRQRPPRTAVTKMWVLARSVGTWGQALDAYPLPSDAGSERSEGPGTRARSHNRDSGSARSKTRKVVHFRIF